MYRLYHDDILNWAKEYQGELFHAMLLDPPYHLTSIVKRFGKAGSAPAKGDVYNRSSKGFMGQDWDGGELIFRPETWEILAQHLYPGGFGMAFASSRGWHRMAVAIEDAGLIFHPSIFMMGWNYLSGFPKATRIKGAKEFNGHRYGLQALKPALEPIIVFQRPYEGRSVNCIVETGAGALWIDGGRISTDEPIAAHRNTARNEIYGKFNEPYQPGDSGKYTHTSGRWPANFTLTHSPACNGTCAPGCPVRLFDEQAGITTSKPLNTIQSARDEQLSKGAEKQRIRINEGYDDSGPASRMFHCSDFAYEIAERLANAGPVHYQPKVSPAEREAGLDSLEIKTRHRVNSGGLENESRFAPVKVKNHHPTLKPISLTKYLATLLLPPATYAPRRILCPFAGAGSEMIGAILAGWDEVIGIEKTAAYIPIAEARLAWWSQWPGWGQTDVDKILAADTSEDSQLFLFAQMEST